MITIRHISQIDYNEYDEVWAIVRSLKYVGAKIRHVPELSPSWNLFKRYRSLHDAGRWNNQTFHDIYVPQFLKEMQGKKQRALLNELFATKKRICLVCFCTEEELCHRSIIGGLLQGAGLDVKGLEHDYSYYFDWYQNGVPGISDNVQPIANINPNTVFLYELKENEKPFENEIPTLCFTGRRPKDLCGYNEKNYAQFTYDLAKLLYEAFYVKLRIRRFISGGAQGFDQLAFWAVERMKKIYKCTDVENVIYVPFEQQESRWAEKGCFSKTEYRQMLKRADKVVVVCEENVIESLFARNHTMCDHSDYCLALYPDDNWQSKKGGTAECLRYAVVHCGWTLRLGYDIKDNGLHIGGVTVLSAQYTG